jgi:AbrB family looped-hinge helix DNA binding protein
MPKSTITSKGQTTVPRQVREQLGVGPGDTLRWETVGNSVHVTVSERAFLNRRGTLRMGPGSVEADIRAARDERGRDGP